jgi:predicted phage baseplate assembly protein
LSLQAEALKPGDGRPYQSRALAAAPLQAESLKIYTLEGGRWVSWQASTDLDAAGPAGASFVLDPTTGELRFGDGERGRALPSGAWPLASYRTTRAEGGNLPAGTIQRLADCPLNRALAGSLHPFTARIYSITNPLPAEGGAPAETVDAAIARMRAELARPRRAVTLEDIQDLARETPGVRLARVTAIPNLHPAYPCMQAPGVVTVIILPYLPASRPQPSSCLLRAVRAYLAFRRVLGTRLVVVGPQYVPVSVRAQVRARAGVDRAELPARIAEALERFFHPLSGGPEGVGWPFGRDVYRSEVLQVIDEIPGVDHVLSLELVGAEGEPSCGNLCLGKLGLVAAGPSQIEVV